MNTELTLRRDHLAEHRRLIIGRSLVAALAGAVPIPLLDERLLYVILRGTVRKLAQGHQIDVDDEAAKHIIFGKAQPPDLGVLASSMVVFRAMARSFRKVMIAYMAARRAQAATHYFTTATLFDHYCARLHVGLGIDSEMGEALRQTMDRAIAETQGGLGRDLFRRGVTAAIKASVRAPLELANIVSRGAVDRLLSSSDPDAVVVGEELDVVLERELVSQSSFIARVATAIELQLSVEANPYLDQLVDNFERMWRDRRQP